MNKPGSRWLAERLGFFVASDVFDAALLDVISGNCERWNANASPIYRGEFAERRLDEKVRSSRMLDAPTEVIDRITDALADQVSAISDHFDVPLSTLEVVQLLHYQQGDHFAKHRDGRTNADGSLPSTRQVSLIVSLSEPSDYDGGELVLFPEALDTHGRGLGLKLNAGDLLAFRSDVAHQVLPVTAGNRISAVTWAA